MSTPEEIMDKAHSMPLISQNTMRLMDIISDEDHSLQDLAGVIKTDPAMTAKILGMVNSAAFGLRQDISTVDMALPYIGEKMIIAMAMSLCPPQVFQRPLWGYESQKTEMWEHSIRAAIAGSEIAHFAKEKTSPGVAYTGGILHDIGKSVLSQFITGSSPDMIQKIERGDVNNFLEAEVSHAGVDHCTVGKGLAEHWNLPLQLQAVIAHHHKPEEADEEYRTLVYIIHLADMLAMMGGSGTGVDSLRYSLDEKYVDFINVAPDRLVEIILNVMIEFDKTRQALSGRKGEG